MTTPITLSPRKRPRRERLLAALALPLLALGLIAGGAVSAGVASAATPASSTYRYLCTTNAGGGNLCAIAQGSQNYVVMDGNTSPPINTTNWYYPTGTAYTTIRQADTSLCMQLDHNASNRIIEAPCTSASYQEWDLTSNSEFRSEWDKSLCLTSLALGGGALYASTCTAGALDQIFHALT